MTNDFSLPPPASLPPQQLFQRGQVRLKRGLALGGGLVSGIGLLPDKLLADQHVTGFFKSRHMRGQITIGEVEAVL